MRENISNNKNYPLIYFSIGNWPEFSRQRPEHLCLNWSLKRTVVYVNTGRTIGERIKLLIAKPKNFFRFCKKIKRNLYIIDNPFLFPRRHKIFFANVINGFLNYILIKRIIRKLNINKYIVGTSDVTAAFNIGFFKKENLFLFYDCVDEHKEFPNVNKKVINKLEKKIANSVDIIFTSSKVLKEKKEKEFNKKVFLVPNGVEINHFNLEEKPAKELLAFLYPLIGYVGLISKWFDFNLLEYCLKKEPSFNYILIGPADLGCDKILKELKRKYTNFHWLGRKDYKDIPKYIAGFDVCIIPFKVNELIKAVDPIKVYEYLAMRKPVVSIYWREMEKFSSIIALAKNQKEFLEGIRKELKTAKDVKMISLRRKFAEENSWEKRASQMEKPIWQGRSREDNNKNYT